MRLVHRLAVAALALAAGCGNSSVNRARVIVRVEPQALDFGNLGQGAHLAKPVVLHNDGVTTLNVSSVAISNDARHAFSVDAGPSSLVSGASATLQVTYTAPADEGADGASLTFSSNADNAPELVVSLSGRSVSSCVAESDAAFCARLGKNCDAVTAADNCGAGRTASCGACTGVQTCGGTGIANVCGTPAFAVTVTRTGAGSVASSPAGISCGSTCSAPFDSGSTVTLTATPDASATFAGWSGDCTNATGPCTLSMNGAKNVTATFTPLRTLTVATSGSGAGVVTAPGAPGISCTAAGNGSSSGTCSMRVPDGTQVTLTAASVSGSRFAGWSGACSSVPCTLALTADASATATFIAQAALTVTRSGNGTVASDPVGISCGTACSAPFDLGSTVTLTAAADASATFAGWSGDCTNATGPCTLSMNGAKNVTATFTPLRTLTVATSGSGAGSVSGNGIACSASGNGVSTGTCSLAFVSGTSITLSASTSGGARFAGWSGACTSAPCTFTLNADATATASFVATAAVNVTLAGAGTGSVTSSPGSIDCGTTCSQAFDVGTQITLTATPAGSSTFTSFSGACASSTATCTFNVGAANEVTATFAAPAATTAWTQLSPTGTAPSARYAMGSAYDVAGNRLIVFGGGDGNVNVTPTLHNDTWVLSNADGASTPAWTQLAPTGGPPQARGYPVMAYDAGTNAAVMFGGNHAISFCFGTNNDTWLLSNANGTGGTPAWTQLSPAGPPSVRNLHSGVYDSANKRLIVFGGGDACGPYLNETWVLSGMFSGSPTWTQLAPSGTLPPGKAGHVATYDSANNRMIVWGGSDTATWILSHANNLGGTPAWTQLTTSGTPPGLVSSSKGMYFPGENVLVVVSGGSSTAPTAATQAFLLTHANGDGGAAAWSQLSPTGGPPQQYGDFALWERSDVSRLTIWSGLTCANSSCGLTSGMWALTYP